MNDRLRDQYLSIVLVPHHPTRTGEEYRNVPLRDFPAKLAPPALIRIAYEDRQVIRPARHPRATLGAFESRHAIYASTRITLEHMDISADRDRVPDSDSRVN